MFNVHNILEAVVGSFISKLVSPDERNKILKNEPPDVRDSRLGVEAGIKKELQGETTIERLTRLTAEKERAKAAGTFKIEAPDLARENVQRAYARPELEKEPKTSDPGLQGKHDLRQGAPLISVAPFSDSRGEATVAFDALSARPGSVVPVKIFTPHPSKLIPNIIKRELNGLAVREQIKGVPTHALSYQSHDILHGFLHGLGYEPKTFSTVYKDLVASPQDPIKADTLSRIHKSVTLAHNMAVESLSKARALTKPGAVLPPTEPETEEEKNTRLSTPAPTPAPEPRVPSIRAPIKKPLASGIPPYVPKKVVDPYAEFDSL